MRNRLSFAPFFALALAACQSTVTESKVTTGTEATDPSEPLFTDGVAVPTESARYALAASVTEPAAASLQDEQDEPAPSEASQGDPTAQESFDMVEIRRQRSRALSQQFAELAQQALGRNDFESAREQFAEALQLDPANQAARDGFRRAQALLGDPLAVSGEAFDADVTSEVVKQELLRTRARELTNKGDIALREGNYDEAILNYREAQIVLEYNPLIATESLDQRLIEARLEGAISARDENLAAEAARQRRQGEERINAAREAERLSLENKLRNYYQNADIAFRAQKYDEAAKFAELILVRDPGNELAQTMLEIAREAGHAKRREQIRRDYREQWTKTFEELSQMGVPVNDVLTFDLETWKEAESRTSLSERQIDKAVDPERESVIQALKTSFVPAVDFEAAELADVAQWLATGSKVNFQLSTAAKEELLDPIELKLGRRSVYSVLDTLSGSVDNFAWKIEDGVVVITTKDSATGGQVRVTYSVAELTTPIRDFVAPDINLIPSRGLDPSDEELPERNSSVLEATALESLIPQAVAPETWANDIANSISVTERGQMVVSQTPEVHAQIRELLADLRKATGTLVKIRTQFMRVEDNFLEDIGVDFRGLGQPGLGANGIEFNDFGDGSSEVGNVIGRTSDVGAYFDDGEDGAFRARIEDLYDSQLGNNTFEASGGLSFQWAFLNDLQLQLVLRAVSKSERIETVTSPTITVNNGSRANVTVLNQVAYVQDFDVQIAQAASIADPIIKVIQDGVILDVRPVVSADRRFITLELRPTIAQLTRPIAEQPTTLGTQNTVTIQLPEVEIQRVRTSIPMPDGSTVLLGGLKESTEQDKRSGVPILNRIPLMNFFFDRKGNFVSNRKLLILVNAEIVIPEEEVPTAAEMGRDQ